MPLHSLPAMPDRNWQNTAQPCDISNMARALAAPPKPFGFGDPQEVVSIIYKCATENTSGVRHFVGKDAKLVARLKRLLPACLIRRMLEKTLMPNP